MIGPRFLLSLAVASAMAVPGVAGAATKIELLVIGNNQPPVAAGGASSLARLRFADDDAAAFFDLMEGTAETAHLLTVMDAETQTLYPGLVAKSRPPTMGEVMSAVEDVGNRIQQNRRAGDSTVVYLFFSGHGMLRDQAGPALALLDGGITQQVLYDEILEKLPAENVHLFVDACHAEAVVRPRDLDAQAVPISSVEASAFLMRSTLARFPQVGAIVAAASDAQAHEWDLFQQGVFTHELLSALRGAADVNHDGRIEYSEIYAFIASANRSVHDARARLSVVARPPEQDRHVAVLDLRGLSGTTTARLTSIPAHAGLVELEDQAGRRIASLRGEPGYLADLVVPSSQLVYVRANGREASFDAAPGQQVAFGALTFRDLGTRPRGALEDAVRTGLFASEFGRGYYRGFIDRSPDFAAVSFGGDLAQPAAAEVELAKTAAPPPPDAERSSRLRPARVFVGGGFATPIARPFDVVSGGRIEAHPAFDHGLAWSLDLEGARATGVAEWRAAVSGGWIWSAPVGPARGWLGAMGGAGMIGQSATGHSDRYSGLVSVGPTAGISLDVLPRVGIWAEAQVSGLAFRRDREAAFLAVPSAFVGAVFAR